MELYIFNRDLTFIGIIDAFQSFIWSRKYHKTGEFELHCLLTNDSLQLLQEENVIYKRDDEEAGYIETITLSQDEEGKEIIVAKGKFITSYINRRIIWGTAVLNTTAENAMRTLINDNCITPSNPDRILDNLILGTSNNFTEEVDYQVSYANLLDEMENLSNISGLGYRIKLDITNKKLIFDIYKGLDRSINQDINTRAIFSKEFDNIVGQEYNKSLNNYKNVALVGGVGEGVDRKTAVVGESSGLDRFEIFNDQRGLSNQVDNGDVMPDVDYTNLLIGKGTEVLAGCKKIETFNSKLNLDSNLQYKVDYDLGDIITIMSIKWGLTLDTRITEIEEVYEEEGMTINVVFGNNIPTLIDKIKNISKQQTGSGGSGTVTATNIDGGTF